MTQPGSVVEVLLETRGSELIGSYAAGTTTVIVADPTPFDDAGGQVLIDGVAYSYSTAGDAAETGSSGLTVTDNGDGTLDVSGPGVVDNGDGTLDASGAGVTDNGDGTVDLSTVTGGSSTGETFGQLILTTGLVADVADMMPVAVWNGAQVLDDLVLAVATGEEGDPPTPVTVTSDQRAFWEAYEGPVDPPIAVLLSDDLQRLEDAPGWTPAINGGVVVNLPDPAEVALDPPDVSPAVKTVQGNSSGLTVVTEPVLPSTLIDYYVNGVLVAADQRTTVINLTTTDTSGTPMGLDTDYTVTTLAHNSGGEAPMSTGVTARLDPGVTATQIIAILQAGFILTGSIQVGTSMVLDGSGFTITHPDGRQTIMRADGSGNQFVGQAILDAATILGSLTILGQNNFLNGLLTLGTGISDPTSKPGVSANYGSTTFADHYRGRGLVLDGAGNWLTTDTLFNNGVVQSYNTTTGAGAGYFSTPNGFDLAGGVTKLGSNIYVLGKDTSRGAAWYVYIYNTSGTKLGEWAPVSGSNESLTIGNDGTNLLIAKVTGVGNLYVSTYSTSGTETSALLCGTNAGWTASTTLSGVLKVAVDTATVRYVVATTGSILVVNTSTGARIAGEEFPTAATPVLGLGHDGTNFHTFDGLKVWHYTNLIGIWDFAFTWVDSDAGGTGTAETKASKLLTTAPRKRARWTVSLPSAPPDDGTTDGANTASLYAVPTGGTLVRQAALSEGTLAQTFSTLLTSGTASPVSNGFASRTGALGRIKSSGGVWDLLGDNTGRVGPWSWDANGYGTQDNVMASASADAAPTSTSNVTIPGLSASVISPGTGAVWMVTLAADVLIGGTAGGNIVELLIDGTPHASLVVSAGAANARFAASKRYRVTGLASGSRTFTARTRSQGAYTTTVNQTHTTMTVERVA